MRRARRTSRAGTRACTRRPRRRGSRAAGAARPRRAARWRRPRARLCACAEGGGAAGACGEGPAGRATAPPGRAPRAVSRRAALGGGARRRGAGILARPRERPAPANSASAARRRFLPASTAPATSRIVLPGALRRLHPPARGFGRWRCRWRVSLAGEADRAVLAVSLATARVRTREWAPPSRRAPPCPDLRADARPLGATPAPASLAAGEANLRSPLHRLQSRTPVAAPWGMKAEGRTLAHRSHRPAGRASPWVVRSTRPRMHCPGAQAPEHPPLHRPQAALLRRALCGLGGRYAAGGARRAARPVWAGGASPRRSGPAAPAARGAAAAKAPRASGVIAGAILAFPPALAPCTTTPRATPASGTASGRTLQQGASARRWRRRKAAGRTMRDVAGAMLAGRHRRLAALALFAGAGRSRGRGPGSWARRRPRSVGGRRRAAARATVARTASARPAGPAHPAAPLLPHGRPRPRRATPRRTRALSRARGRRRRAARRGRAAAAAARLPRRRGRRVHARVPARDVRRARRVLQALLQRVDAMG
jgi:hypothetical protein